MDIVLEKVTAGYGAAPVLKDISMRISEGERVLLAGPNGSGKTTLLRVIANLLPSEGEITYGGVRKESIKRKKLASLVSLMPQTSEMYFSYTVEQTVMLGRYSHMKGLLAVPGSEDIEAVRNAMNRSGVYEMRNRALNELSGGQLQRTLLARTIAQETPFMFLDEPGNNLDIKHSAELVDYLNLWTEEKTVYCGEPVANTLVAVFHDFGQASLCLDRAIVLNDGEIVCDESIKEIVSTNKISEIYGFDVAGYKRRESELWNSVQSDKLQ